MGWGELGQQLSKGGEYDNREILSLSTIRSYEVDFLPFAHSYMVFSVAGNDVIELKISKFVSRL